MACDNYQMRSHRDFLCAACGQTEEAHYDTIYREITMQKHKQVGGTHYMDMDIEPIHAMRAWSTEDEFVGHCKLTAIKYLARVGRKAGNDPATELKKARQYIEFALEALENPDD